MLKRLKLQNFRNYSSLDLDLGRGNIFIGGNAQGKTNILEAVSLLSYSRSFRSKDIYLIKHDEDFFTVEGELEDLNIRIVGEGIDDVIRKTIQKKGVKVSARNILGEFLSVIFSPEDVTFFTDSPSVRRRYLNIVLCQASKEYLETIIKYGKILEQRNAALKKIRETGLGKDELPVWNENLVREGIKIIEGREEFLKMVNENIRSFWEKFSGESEEINVGYKGSASNREVFENKLKEKERLDIMLGATTTGPHRDDIVFMKNGREMAPYGSRGEYRTMVLALKFCEGKYLEESLGKKATYLLDDVFSELDAERRKSLFQLVKENPFIITTTDRDHIDKSYLEAARIFNVAEGKVKPPEQTLKRDARTAAS